MVVTILFFKPMALSPSPIAIRNYANVLRESFIVRDFRGIHLLEAIQNYQKRERRFGGLGETFTDEDLDALEPAAEVAEEIVTKLTPKQLTPR